MVAIRAPFSALGGVLLSAGLFLGLAQLVNVSFPAGDLLIADSFTFKPSRVDSPVRTTRDRKIEREKPHPVPGIPGPTRDDGDVRVQPIRYVPPTLGKHPDRGSGLRGFDGDVIAVATTPPEYPQRALAGNIEGWVQVRFTVTAVGTVRDAVVVESEPGTVFDDAALRAVARWRYNPRVENGEAVERVGLQTMIRFTLEN